MLPQHARMCGPLEAGALLGYPGVPTAHDHESFQMRRTGPGAVDFPSSAATRPRPTHLFTLHYTIPATGVGVWSEDLSLPRAGRRGAHRRRYPGPARRAAAHGQPVGPTRRRSPWRGANDFRTAPGWDTVFTGVLNEAQPPSLCARDGAGRDGLVRLRHGVPLRAPGGRHRERLRTCPGRAGVRGAVRDTRLRQADQDEVDAFRASQHSFTRKKLDARAENALGLEYDTLYREASRAAARPSPAPPG